jgi:integrase
VTYRDQASALTALGAMKQGTAAVRARAADGRTFGSLAREWMAGVEAGTIQRRRRGQPRPYSSTTIPGYRRDLLGGFPRRDGSRPIGVLEEFHGRVANEITESEWQEFFDDLRDRGLSYSRLGNVKAVASSIYEYASYRTRRNSTGVASNPLRDIDLGANTGRRRERVASADEATALLVALAPEDQVPYGIALYAGLRRIDIDRLDWRDVEMVDGKPGDWLRVRPMEEAGPGKVGAGRRVPIAAPLRAILLAAYIRQGRPVAGKVSDVSVMSGKLAGRAKTAWGAVGLEPIGLHECRHTYCSFLIAARVDLAHIMRWMGHTQLSTTQRYIHVIEERLSSIGEAEPLDAYFREREAQAG